jgi:Glycosyl transferases group 1
MPIRTGAGTRIKALDAIAVGVPVISTVFGIEGLGLRPGRDVLIADSPEEFAAKVLATNDVDLRAGLVSSAFARIAQSQSPTAVEEAIRQAVLGLLVPAR